jgi:hypothetical protein
MKPTRYTLERITKATQTAHDDSSLSGEAYDRLIQAGIEDMRRKKARGWRDTVVVVDDRVEAPPVDDTDWTYPSSPCEATTATPGTEPENRDPVEARAESSAKNGNGEAEAPPSVEEGYGFVWCLDCGRLDRIRYENRTLPEYFEGGVGEQKCGIVLILCGLCRRTPARITVAKSQLESRITSSFHQLRLGAQVFEASGAVRAARAVMQRDVQVLSNAFGVVYRDVDKIVRELGVDDQIVSVNLEKFREREGQEIVLPYLRGGLLNSQVGRNKA